MTTRESIQDRIAERIDPEELKEQAQQLVSQVKKGLARADEQTRSFVMDRPLLAIGCAFGVGFIIARLLAGRED